MEMEVPGTAGEGRPKTANRHLWPSPRQWTVVALLIATLSLAMALVARSTGFGGPRTGSSSIAYTEKSPRQGPTASLEIDFGNGVRREFTGIAWRKGMTAGDLMQAARRMSPGLDYEIRGSGEMTLLTALDGVANGQGDGRYWLYEINGRPAEVSFVVKPVAAGDRVLWVFRRPE